MPPRAHTEHTQHNTHSHSTCSQPFNHDHGTILRHSTHSLLCIDALPNQAPGVSGGAMGGAMGSAGGCATAGHARRRAMLRRSGDE